MTNPDAPRSIDGQLRRLLDPERDAPDQYDELLRASRSNNRERATLLAPEPRQRSKRTLGVAIPIAAALLAIVMLTPSLRDGSQAGQALQRLAPDASAAEALDVARGAILETGPAVGSGDVWHGVSRTYHDGKLVTINEQWYGTSTDQHLLAAWGVSQDDGRELLLLDRFDRDGVHRIRTFELPETQSSWRFPPGLSPTNAMDLPAGGSDRQRELPIAVRQWLIAASDRRSTPASLRAATRRFIDTTPDHFMEAPELPVPTRSGPVAPTDREAMDVVRELDRVRRVLYLLTTVQVAPAATAELYDVVGGFDSLERLPDVEIDGRLAMRIRFDPRADRVSPHRERVVVIDMGSGRIVRTETLDRTSWTEIEPARRVERIGDARFLCRGESSVPCDALLGRGELEAQASAFAFNMAVRYAAHAQNRKNRALGNQAPPPLCMQMSERGECIPNSPYERARLEEISRDQRALHETFTFNNSTPRLNDDDAFATARPISWVPDEDGAIRPAGNCVRDWRWLTVCRG